MGIISDRIGRKKVLLSGFALCALVYFLLATAWGSGLLWVIFPLYGIYMALTEGVGKAYISLHAREELAGTTYGIYQTITGLCTFIASLAAGFLWKYWSHGAPVILGAGMALAAAAIFAFAREDRT